LPSIYDVTTDATPPHKDKGTKK